MPRENGHPVTHWDTNRLARLAVEAGIFEEIHPTTIWNWLNEAEIKPHRCQYWLKCTDPEFDWRMADITDLYLRAPRLWKHDHIPVICVDEKTSIQALERKHKTLPPRSGTVSRIEHEYIRHGILHLTAAFEVPTGIVEGELTRRRRAKEFASFVKTLCARYAGSPQIHLVCDQLNTHWNHKVCEVVAQESRIAYDPQQHPTGKERKPFLEDPRKRVVFHFTPKHASWLNQIEIWFSLLSRKLLKRESFSSKQDLEEKILEFIEYYNSVLAHPYKWTYTGTPLQT